VNHIPAIGAPGSLLRAVQENPTVVIELLDACRAAYRAECKRWIDTGRCKPDSLVPPLMAKLAGALHQVESILGVPTTEFGVTVAKPVAPAAKSGTTPGGATDGAGISAACRGTEDAAGMPSVVLGPGGDYVRGIPPRVGTKLDVKA